MVVSSKSGSSGYAFWTDAADAGLLLELPEAFGAYGVNGTTKLFATLT